MAEQAKKMTRKEKIAAGEPKAPKRKKAMAQALANKRAETFQQVHPLQFLVGVFGIHHGCRHARA